jgi:ABC-type transport system involved in multi-copper enzyme maturation permease subunit
VATEAVFRKTILQRAWEDLKGTFRQVFSNPVIGRELKVRVRLARSYWLQGAYLMFLLGLVAFAYVTTVETQVGRNPFEAQSYLQEFYQIILITITSLIVLIAPALTAAALTLERERRTMDLLLATPLKARDLLVGKLLGSFAFILLLLALSLPASGVCVLLGGATFGELLKTYTLIAFSGMFVCALALSCSAINNHSGRAVFFAYMLVMVFLFGTGIFAGAAISSSLAMGGMNECYFPLAALNPFTAPFIADTVVPLFGYKVPTWIVGTVLCLLFTRLVLTGTARRVGLYDVDTLGSLRRQVLFLSALVVLVSMNAPPIPWVELRQIEDWTGFWLTIIAVLPSFILLFVPWVATWGARDNKAEPVDGWFRVWRMFSRSSAGALPFLYLWLAICLGMILVTVYYQLNGVPFPEMTAWMCLYAFSLITVFWAIGRFFSAIARDILMARVLSVGVSLIYIFLPLMVAMQLSDYNSLANSIWLKPWIFYPFAQPFLGRSAEYMSGLFMTHTIYLFMTAAIVFLLAVLLERGSRTRNSNRRAVNE